MKYNIIGFDEKVIKDGVASQIEVDGIAAVSGNLVLTDSRILLIPHKLKRNSPCLEIPLNRIKKSDDEFCVFCNRPNIVEITTIDNKCFKFSVKKGQKTNWEQSINTAVIQYIENHPFQEYAQTQTEQSSYEITSAAFPPRVNNILIWLIAFSPAIGLFFEYGFWLFILIAMGFCYWDESNLRRLGYDTFQLGYACIIPVYLYKRAKLCGTSKSLLVVWCFMILAAAFFTFSSLQQALLSFFNALKDVSENTIIQ